MTASMASSQGERQPCELRLREGREDSGVNAPALVVAAGLLRALRVTPHLFSC
jgi:hypothetical protein